jgi:superfamily II DNA/RNA helicase
VSIALTNVTITCIETLKARAGRKGTALTFFTKEDGGENAGALVTLLRGAKQVVPPALEALAPATAAVVDAAAEKRLAKKEQKKASKAIREGDWRCGKCGSNVFATKDTCFKCKTPKTGVVSL